MQERNKNFLVLGLILGVFLAFFLAGRFLVNVDELPRINKGTLIIPHVSIDSLALTSDEGTPYTGADMAGQWTMAYIAGDACDTACKNGLFYLMRQLRLSLDRDATRVRRLIIHTAEADAELREFLNDNVAGMYEAHGQRDVIEAALGEAMAGASPLHHIFIISPDGMIFLWYPTHADRDSTLLEADNIRDDLKRTLKGSAIG